MTPERWAQIEELFHRAAECDPKLRACLLDAACKGDEELRQVVEGLLANEENAHDDIRAAVQSGVETVSFPLLGETVSHYRIVAGLRGGGMGIVYTAEDMKLGRQVALKFLPEESARSPEALNRFEREARSASALEHPNICPIYEFGEHEGQPFLVMQLLEGQTLRELISESDRTKPPLELPKLLDISLQIVDALEAAHQHGIIHRDIKPANIFLTTTGQVKLLDFGLAKLSHDEDAEEAGLLLRGGNETEENTLSPTTPDAFLSHVGVAMGTAGYMSPEQARGEKLDARTDLFSFGLVLYEMATGQRAFQGDTRPGLCQATLKQSLVPPKHFNPRLPARLEAIIGKALKIDRVSRYQSASELRADLKAAAPAEFPWRLVAFAACVALFCAAVGTYYFWSRSKNPATPAKTKQMVLRDLTATTDNAFISPDGTQLAIDTANGLSLRQISTGDTRVLDKGPDLSVASWYPDGAHLLATDENSGGLWKVSTFDGKKQRLLGDQKVAFAAVSPDGKWIVFLPETGPSKIWILGSNGENPMELTSPSEGQVHGLAWSPTSQRILYRSWSVGKAAIGSCDRQGGHQIEIVSDPYLGNMLGMNDVYWGRDGRVFYTLRESAPLEANIWAVPVDPETGQVTGEPSRVTSYTGLNEGAFSESKNGKLLFYKVRRKDAILIADINRVSGELRKATPLPTEGWNAKVPLWTHDGRKLVFYSSVRGELGFYIEDLQTQEIQALVTEVESFGYGPPLGTLTSDGKWLLFTRPPSKRSAGESAELMRMPLDGGPATHLLTGNFRFQCALRAPVCVLREMKTDQRSFFQLDPIRGRGALLAHAENLDPFEADWSLSLDGRNVAYLPKENGNQIEILSLEGKSSRTIVLDGGSLQSPTWAADNEHLYVVSNQQGNWNMLYVEPSGKYKTALTSPREAWITWPQPSPDGRRLAFQQTIFEGNAAMLENY